jgi:hypothetical protein
VLAGVEAAGGALQPGVHVVRVEAVRAQSVEERRSEGVVLLGVHAERGRPVVPVPHVVRGDPEGLTVVRGQLPGLVGGEQMPHIVPLGPLGVVDLRLGIRLRRGFPVVRVLPGRGVVRRFGFGIRTRHRGLFGTGFRVG